MVFPLVNMTAGKYIVWDSCQAHIAHKDHSWWFLSLFASWRYRNFQKLERFTFKHYQRLENSNSIEYTKEVTQSLQLMQLFVYGFWMLGIKYQIALLHYKHFIASAGFADDYQDWHISKHGIDGDKIAWQNRLNDQVDSSLLEHIPQEDDMLECVDDAIGDITL